MSEASGGNVEKAFFWNVDLEEYFEVQYNPKDFKFNKQVSWKEHDDQGKVGSLEFQKSSPATLVVELMFDTTKDLADVRKVWVNKLLELLNAEFTPTSGEGESMDKERPPIVWFFWGNFDFYGVIESVDVTYLMFASDGNPLRAKVNVKMKEWETESYTASGSSEGYDSSPVSLVTLQAGETVSSVALRLGTTTQAICEDNNIDDPTDVPAGTELAVRTGS
jgi:hypothetical protein